MPATEQLPASAPPDKYDRAIAYLRQHPDEIVQAWLLSRSHPGGCLFSFVSHDRQPLGSHGPCGCPVMIRNPIYKSVAETEHLTAAIRADDRIPMVEKDITLDHLPIFAAWQRRIDRELGRTA
jgi:hypothetical protein